VHRAEGVPLRCLLPQSSEEELEIGAYNSECGGDYFLSDIPTALCRVCEAERGVAGLCGQIGGVLCRVGKSG